MRRLNPFEQTAEWTPQRLDRLALAVFLVGLALRLWAIPKSFVNPDEAYQVLLASPHRFAALFHSVLRSPRPPLFLFLLHAVRQLSHSDAAIRLAPALAGALFPVVVYLWISRGWGKHAALAAMATLMFAPELIKLSVETRDYLLALLFMALALYWLDAAIEHRSPLRMATFCLFLYLGILTNYSVAFFVVAAGLYFLLRIREPGVTEGVRIVWELGQVGAVVLYAFLYVVQIHPLQSITVSRTDITGWLHDAYPQPGQNPLWFAVLGTARQFAYLFPLLVPAVAAIVLFLIGIYFIWRRRSPERARPSRALAVLLLVPFAAACGGAFLYLYPYGRSYHSVFLSLFIATGVAIGLDRIGRGWIVPLAAASLILVPLYYLTLGPRRSEVANLLYREHHMRAALAYLKQAVPPGSLILTSSEVRVQMIYYLEGGDRQPELHGVPSVERVGPWRLLANRWSFAAPADLRRDLRLARGAFGWGPGRRIWVIDGGFQELLQTPLNRLHRQGVIPEIHNFGKAMVVFRTPPGFFWEPPRPGDRLPPGADRTAAAAAHP